MTDVVRLINSGTQSTFNGYSVQGAMVRSHYDRLAPKINSQTSVSGVLGVTNNGYLGGRFK